MRGGKSGTGTSEGNRQTLPCLTAPGCVRGSRERGSNLTPLCISLKPSGRCRRCEDPSPPPESPPTPPRFAVPRRCCSVPTRPCGGRPRWVSTVRGSVVVWWGEGGERKKVLGSSAPCPAPGEGERRVPTERALLVWESALLLLCRCLTPTAGNLPRSEADPRCAAGSGGCGLLGWNLCPPPRMVSAGRGGCSGAESNRGSFRQESDSLHQRR